MVSFKKGRKFRQLQRTRTRNRRGRGCTGSKCPLVVDPGITSKEITYEERVKIKEAMDAVRKATKLIETLELETIELKELQALEDELERVLNESSTGGRRQKRSRKRKSRGRNGRKGKKTRGRKN